MRPSVVALVGVVLLVAAPAAAQRARAGVPAMADARPTEWSVDEEPLTELPEPREFRIVCGDPIVGWLVRPPYDFIDALIHVADGL